MSSNGIGIARIFHKPTTKINISNYYVQSYKAHLPFL